VAIPVVSVRLVKKHKTAGLVPNGLAITTDTSQKDEFPPVDEFPTVLKWRRKPSVVSVSSTLPDLLGNSTSSLSVGDTAFQKEAPLD
ncbi:hypothetical protein CRUP_038874, partial [Coryphaenoides rupestris]